MLSKGSRVGCAILWLWRALNCPEARGIFIPRPGVEPVYPALEGSFLNHQGSPCLGLFPLFRASSGVICSLLGTPAPSLLSFPQGSLYFLTGLCPSLLPHLCDTPQTSSLCFLFQRSHSLLRPRLSKTEGWTPASLKNRRPLLNNRTKHLLLRNINMPFATVSRLIQTDQQKANGSKEISFLK